LFSLKYMVAISNAAPDLVGGKRWGGEGVGGSKRHKGFVMDMRERRVVREAMGARRENGGKVKNVFCATSRGSQRCHGKRFFRLSATGTGQNGIGRTNSHRRGLRDILRAEKKSENLEKTAVDTTRRKKTSKLGGKTLTWRTDGEKCTNKTTGQR